MYQYVPEIHGTFTCLTLLEPQSLSGDDPRKFEVVCPLNGTAVLRQSEHFSIFRDKVVLGNTVQLRLNHMPGMTAW